MVNVLNRDIVENKFDFQLRNYIHFQNNTIRKGMNLFILPLQQWVKWRLYYLSTTMVTALNNPRELICH